MFQLAVFSALVALTAGASLSSQRIVGGRNSSAEEVPYQSAIERLYQTCSGVIISNRHILSAGHCFYDDDVTKLYIRVGSALLESGGTLLQPSKIVHHPKYSVDDLFDYDVAVVELKEDLVFSDTIQPIKLADSEPSEGAEVFTSGWGSTVTGRDPSKILQIATTVIADRQKCQDQFGDSGAITDRMVCAGGTKTGLCKGDAGGPLTTKSDSGDQVLDGIASLEFQNCHQPGFYDVYTNVAHPEIRSFIHEQTGV